MYRRLALLTVLLIFVFIGGGITQRMRDVAVAQTPVSQPAPSAAGTPATPPFMFPHGLNGRPENGQGVALPSSAVSGLPQASPPASAPAAPPIELPSLSTAEGQQIRITGNQFGALSAGTATVSRQSASVPQTTTSGPVARIIAAMAFDAARGTTVLFSGLNNTSGVSGDTWIWNGSAWIGACGTSGTSPCAAPARSQASMAYDAARGVIVLFGGFGCTTSPGGNCVNFLSDTWTWNGSIWAQQSLAVSPPARSNGNMVFDAVRRVIVLFGGNAGCTSSGCTNFSDTWTWDGTTWTQQHPSMSPPYVQSSSMAYDAATSTTLLFQPGPTSHTWTWDGATWIEQHPAMTPTVGSGASMAYDAATTKIVLFGGCCYGSDMWTWDGGNWTRRSPTPSPSAREAATMAYDSTRQVVVLFGGAGGMGVLDDTWTWNGSTWVQQIPATPLSLPAPRVNPNLAYDKARDVVLLFSGIGSGNLPLNDTWIWNGSTWAQQFPAVSPASGFGPAGMVYDEARGVILLYAAFAGAWTWSGSTWTRQQPATVRYLVPALPSPTTRRRAASSSSADATAASVVPAPT